MRLLGKELWELGRVLEKFIGNDNLGIRDLPFEFQFNSLERVVNLSNSWGFHQAGEPKEKVSIDDPKDVVHENLYAALEHALISSITSVALKE